VQIGVKYLERVLNLHAVSVSKFVPLVWIGKPSIEKTCPFITIKWKINIKKPGII
jgi:hypothetical protein